MKILLLVLLLLVNNKLRKILLSLYKNKLIVLTVSLFLLMTGCKCIPSESSEASSSPTTAPRVVISGTYYRREDGHGNIVEEWHGLTFDTGQYYRSQLEMGKDVFATIYTDPEGHEEILAYYLPHSESSYYDHWTKKCTIISTEKTGPGQWKVRIS